MSLKLMGIILVICSTLLESVGQMALKSSAAANIVRARKLAFLSGGIACFAVEAVVWSCVLRILEVSVAYPMSSLNFVAVTLLSRLFLHEEVARERWIGVTFILCGTALLGFG